MATDFCGGVVIVSILIVFFWWCLVFLRWCFCVGIFIVLFCYDYCGMFVLI